MALSRHHTALTRPLSVEEIVTEALNFDFHPTRSLQQWIRSAKMLLTEAAVCEQDDNLQMAYLYFYRHAELVLAKLPEHPDYKDPAYKDDLAQARKALQRNLVKLEQWKPRINQEYQRYVKAMERRNAEMQRLRDEGRSSLEGRREDVESSTRTLDAGEDSRLAVELAQREMRRRDASRRQTKRAGIDNRAVAARRQGVVLGDPDDGVREAGRLLDRSRDRPRQPSTTMDGACQTLPRGDSATAYRYPTVISKEKRMDWHAPPLQPSQTPTLPSSRYEIALPPPIPGKESLTTLTPSSPPSLPLKPTSTSLHLPQKYTFNPHATTEASLPLRTLLLPPTLIPTFLRLAASNTASNLETCGILACTPHAGALFLTHLILPAQTSTANTCDTTPAGDAALFDFCDTNSLLVAGWIHTHPSQTCFLSSRDLHTSAGYQVMLPESIAIVCAPRHEPAWGVFRLTDPPGLGHVLECERPGVFHEHGIGGLYTDAVEGKGAVRAGHVVEGPGLEVEVVDLREE